MINIGIIGYGYWGPNLVRNFAETPGATVAAVATSTRRSSQLVAAALPGGQDDHRLPRSAHRPGDRRHRHRHAGQHALRARHGRAQGRQAPLAREADDRDLAAGAQADRRGRSGASSCCSSTTPSSTPARCARWASSSSSGELGRIYYYDSIRVNLGPVPARRQRDLGPRRARLLDPGLPARASIPSRSRPAASTTSPARRRTSPTSRCSTTRGRSPTST